MKNKNKLIKTENLVATDILGNPQALLTTIKFATVPVPMTITLPQFSGARALSVGVVEYKPILRITHNI